MFAQLKIWYYNMKTVENPNRTDWSEILKRPTQTVENIETTVFLHIDFESSINERCPLCSAPIVGTNPMVSGLDFFHVIKFFAVLIICIYKDSTSSLYFSTTFFISEYRFAYCIACFGGLFFDNPIISWKTWICPSQVFPEPIPMVGMFNF